MSARENLEKLLENMPEGRLRAIVDFAAFLNSQDEREGWRHSAKLSSVVLMARMSRSTLTQI